MLIQRVVLDRIELYLLLGVGDRGGKRKGEEQYKNATQHEVLG
jgi:hypothetical protein